MTANLPATIPETQAAIGEAQERKDITTANALYIHEQNLRRQPATAAPGAPAVTVPAPLDASKVEEFFELAAEFDPVNTAELRRLWPGSEAAANMGYVKAYLEAHLSPDIRENLVHDPVAMRAAAVLARNWHSERGVVATRPAASPGNPAPAGRPAPVASEAYAITMRDYSARIDQALGEGNHRLANAIEEQKREWLRTVVGNQPAVGHAGRTA